MKQLVLLSSFVINSLTVLSSLAATPSATFDPKVIYGNDDRLDLYQIQDPTILAKAASTVALIGRDDMTFYQEDNRFKLKGETLKDLMKTCDSEPFAQQPTDGFCSGALVGPDLILTAGHCITDNEDCEKTRFVFDYAVKNAQSNPKDSLAEVEINQVYRCTEIIGRVLEDDGADFAVVRMDRPVFDRPFLRIGQTRNIQDQRSLFVIGHPSGLPTKVAGGASIRSKDFPGHFLANLDTYGGNSGSSVFDAQTGKILGILVRGEKDYEYDMTKGCFVSNRCEDSECSGESVTKIAEAWPAIQKGRASTPDQTILKASRLEQGLYTQRKIHLLNRYEQEAEIEKLRRERENDKLGLWLKEIAPSVAN